MFIYRAKTNRVYFYKEIPKCKRIDDHIYLDKHRILYLYCDYQIFNKIFGVPIKENEILELSFIWMEYNDIQNNRSK